MGGCYSSCSSFRESSERSRSSYETPAWKTSLKKFANNSELEDLISAYKSYFNSKNNGFFGELAKVSGISNIEDIPKEFPETEYEVKFDIQPSGKDTEPSIKQYLDAFDFPVGAKARFLKDPIHTSAVGINRFYGDNLDERLVVIEKGGKTFLKEKGKVVPTEVGVPYEQIVIKRTEERHESPMNEILDRISQITSEKDVRYRGKIRKEKGDDFILDSNDGRIYSFTITRAHLTKAGEEKESAIQRQLEIEYAGYIPGFKSLEKGSEKQIVEGMIDMAKYTALLYHNAPVYNGWRMNLFLTNERKYDFVTGRKSSPFTFGIRRKIVGNYLNQLAAR